MGKRAPVSKRLAVSKTLGPGIHPGVVELEANGSYRVALLAGGHVRARLDKGLAKGFVDECMRTGAKMLLHDTPRGPEILGALHAPRELSPGQQDEVELRGKTVRVRAAEEIVLQVGKTTLRLDKTGAARFEGRKLVLDIASLIRMLSARVELP
jgi:hypothetical protein